MHWPTAPRLPPRLQDCGLEAHVMAEAHVRECVLARLRENPALRNSEQIGGLLSFDEAAHAHRRPQLVHAAHV
jgi:hypothetical protein